uniref:DUF2279 domain-containing protein n=1 Tax=candidate division WOR-3 bacterium TaxID=2052148 RepID=A0A7C4TGI9_UNCW3
MKRIVFFILSSIILVLAQNIDSLSDTLRCKREVVYRDAWFAQDKLLHFSVSASIVGLSYHTLVCRLKRDENQGMVYSISFTALIGLGKELYDKKKKRHFSFKDLLWDGIGITAGYFAFIHEY